MQRSGRRGSPSEALEDAQVKIKKSDHEGVSGMLYSNSVGGRSGAWLTVGTDLPGREPFTALCPLPLGWHSSEIQGATAE